MKDKKEQSINIFKQILQDNWEEFKKKYPFYNTSYYNEIVEKALNCGDVKYGYTEYTCMYCGEDKVKIAFSCKSKFCLSCGKVFSDNLTEEISSKMHVGALYRHLTFTIPEQFRIYFYRDRFNGDLLRKFFKAGWECIQDVINTSKRKVLKCGCIMMLHLCGRKGDYKPHLHILLLDGGLDEKQDKWVTLGWFPYEILHKKWQYYLFNMMQEEIETEEIDNLISELWVKYPNGLVADIKEGEIPKKSKGLARYLAKYISSPTISLRRIKEYDSEKKVVEYIYKSHETGKMEKEITDVFTFIGRMVQQILPKGFQRIRYYGLQATKAFKKFAQILINVFKVLNVIAKSCYKVVKKSYADRYKEVHQGKDPFICSKCGHKMVISRIWSKVDGLIYDFFENLKKAPIVFTRGSPVSKESNKIIPINVYYGIQLEFNF